MKWDDDIAGLELSDTEKDGLQVHRNYSRNFNDAREKQFAAGVDYKPPDTSHLGEVIALVLKEEIRFVPVILCAFADEDLASMFKTFLPDGIPGGKKAMLGRFGPISTLFNRIQFAYAFDMMHDDILEQLDSLATWSETSNDGARNFIFRKCEDSGGRRKSFSRDWIVFS